MQFEDLKAEIGAQVASGALFEEAKGYAEGVRFRNSCTRRPVSSGDNRPKCRLEHKN